MALPHGRLNGLITFDSLGPAPVTLVNSYGVGTFVCVQSYQVSRDGGTWLFQDASGVLRTYNGDDIGSVYREGSTGYGPIPLPAFICAENASLVCVPSAFDPCIGGLDVSIETEATLRQMHGGNMPVSANYAATGGDVTVASGVAGARYVVTSGVFDCTGAADSTVIKSGTNPVAYIESPGSAYVSTVFCNEGEDLVISSGSTRPAGGITYVLDYNSGFLPGFANATAQKVASGDTTLIAAPGVGQRIVMNYILATGVTDSVVVKSGANTLLSCDPGGSAPEETHRIEGPIVFGNNEAAIINASVGSKVSILCTYLVEPVLY